MLFVIFFIICQINISPAVSDENHKFDKNYWIARSEQKDNRLITELIIKSDLTEKIDIVRKLGLREDRDFTSIFVSIYYRKDQFDRNKEVLLYYLVNFLIKSDSDYRVNSVITDIIFSDIKSYSDSLLRKEIMRKLLYADNNTALKVLSIEGEMLREISTDKAGINPVILEECRVFAEISGYYNDPVLEQIYTALYRNIKKLENFK